MFVPYTWLYICFCISMNKTYMSEVRKPRGKKQWWSLYDSWDIQPIVAHSRWCATIKGRLPVLCHGSQGQPAGCQLCMLHYHVGVNSVNITALKHLSQTFEPIFYGISLKYNAVVQRYYYWFVGETLNQLRFCFLNPCWTCHMALHWAYHLWWSILQEFFAATVVPSSASSSAIPGDLAQLLEQWQRSVGEAPAVTIAEPPGDGEGDKMCGELLVSFFVFWFLTVFFK